MRPKALIATGLTFIVLVVAGCGATINPRVSTGGTGFPGAFPPEDDRRPSVRPTVGGVETGRPIVDQICRVRGVRSGWITIGYRVDRDECPQQVEEDNPYTLALIERYDQKQVGATMVVCADQGVPGGWTRERSQEGTAGCPGARVPDGAPTAFVIRKVR